MTDIVKRLIHENANLGDDITGDLDLLGDWLVAKGYTEELAFARRAMDEINKLRAALKPFADVAAQFDFADDNEGISGVLLGDLRAAAAALKGDGDEN